MLRCTVARDAQAWPAFGGAAWLTSLAHVLARESRLPSGPAAASRLNR